MKPCSRNRKSIAWLALNELDAPAASKLRAHLEQCDGCRQYWEELSNVTRRLVAAQPDSEIQAGESFYRQVDRRLRNEQPTSMSDSLLAGIRWLLKPRVWVPSLAFLAVTSIVVIAVRTSPLISPPSGAEALPPANRPGDMAPTIANYQMAASQSLDQLDELLTRQGNRPLPRVPPIRITRVEFGAASF